MLEGFIQDVQRVSQLHAGQTRKITGEPYVTHPISVAARLQRLRLDDQTILTGLYHDVLEDTEITEEQLASFHPHMDLPVRLVTHDKNRREPSRHRKMRTLLTLVGAAEGEPLRIPEPLHLRRVAAFVFLADKVDNASAVHALFTQNRGDEVKATFDLADSFWWWETALTTMRVANWLSLGEAGDTLMSQLDERLTDLRAFAAGA